MSQPSFSARYAAAMAVAGAARSRQATWVASPTTSAATADSRPTERRRAGAGPGGRGRGRAGALSRAAVRRAQRRMNNRQPDITNVTKENQIMRDIATATLSGNLTREVELRPLPSGTEVARLRVASGTRRRSGEEWVERTNYFTVEVYGPQASLCAERLGKGSRVVVDGELDWREWTDREQNRREAVVLRARQILFERTGSTRRQTPILPNVTVRRMTSPVPQPWRLRRLGRTTCRSDHAPNAARPPVRGRAGGKPQVGSLFLCAESRSSTCGRPPIAPHGYCGGPRD